ncbi:hypothetical protein FRX31_018880 [Thalictrum thalictroides]|uniref:Uncharacterized protein n=1 Tax=Thalictrum thalictroides TaxID=46969 RepID=A0A7J6W2D9_THATH|nr:hypothetical protein FRX31_018880 [Thalictrum thalictroides]
MIVMLGSSSVQMLAAARLSEFREAHDDTLSMSGKKLRYYAAMNVVCEVLHRKAAITTTMTWFNGMFLQ